MITPTVPSRAATIGQAIRRARFSVGFTQTDQTTVTGILRTNISKYENGKRLPSVDELYAIANACACAVTDLLPETIEAPTPEVQIIVQILADYPDIIPTVLQTLQRHVRQASGGSTAPPS